MSYFVFEEWSVSPEGLGNVEGRENVGGTGKSSRCDM